MGNLNSRHRKLHLISNIEAFRHGGGSQGEIHGMLTNLSFISQKNWLGEDTTEVLEKLKKGLH